MFSRKNVISNDISSSVNCAKFSTCNFADILKIRIVLLTAIHHFRQVFLTSLLATSFTLSLWAIDNNVQGRQNWGGGGGYLPPSDYTF